MLIVTKRDGRAEPYAIEKIREVINFAAEGLDINPLAVEQKFNSAIHGGITTRKITQNLVEGGRALCSPEEPDWSIFSGRLTIMDLWKDTLVYETPFSEFIKEQLDLDIYRGVCQEALKTLNDEDLDELGDYIVRERDLQHSYGSVLSALKRYLCPGESIQQMLMVNAITLGVAGGKRGIMPSRKAVLDYIKQTYDDLSLREISQASPWLSNLRPGMNISSCFTIELEDDIDSIFDNVKRAALISKNGGGLGVGMGRVRARGSDVMGSPNSSGGIMGWVKIFNDVAVTVNQGGKRAGAFTIALPMWHRDIEEFLECQSEAGDFRTRAPDIFPQITVNDIFMEQANEPDGGWWYTFCPHEVKKVLGISLSDVWGKEFTSAYKAAVRAHKAGKIKNVACYNAKELLKVAMKPMFESGLPYVAFIDEINRHNPNKHEGVVSLVNLCTESYSVTIPDVYAHTCNLSSIVMGRMNSKEHIIETARRTTRMLDYGIDITDSPTEISKAHNARFRTIGVGIQGLHDYLAKNWLGYHNYKELTEIAELIQYGCVLESIELAKESGPFPAFMGSTWQTGERIAEFKKHSVSDLTDWDFAQSQIDLYGIRNSQMTSPAPNCQVGTNEILVYGAESAFPISIYELLEYIGVDVKSLEKQNIPCWIDLPDPIQIPTKDGDAVVERVWFNGKQDIIELEFEDGNIYQYTPNHPLLVLRDGTEQWIAVKDLMEGDDIVSI